MGAIARAFGVLAELWIAALILLVVLTLILGVKRIWTVLGLAVAGLFVIAVVRRLATTPEQPAEVPTATIRPAAAIISLPLDRAEVADLAITGITAPWKFQGRVLNRDPDYTLVSATIRIVRRDCYEGALDPTGCVLLWEGSKRVSLSVPPGQQQQFVEQVSPRGSVARAQGTVKDEFELVGLTGRKVDSSS
jgi:hypothetical protein